MGMTPFTAYYENSRGERIRFDEPPVVMTGGDLFDSRWRLSTAVRPNGEGGRLLRGRRPCDERSLELALAAEDAAALAALLERLMNVTEYDIHARRAGRLWVCGQYLSCWCTASVKTLSDALPNAARVTLRVFPETPAWCTERRYSLRAGDNDDLTADRYPRRYPRRYGAGRGTTGVVNRSVAPAPLRVVFYGPAADPRVLVGSSDIGVNVTIAPGERAVVDQLTREVYTTAADGTKTNRFDSRRRSGTTFENAPPGSSPVEIMSGSYVDITLIEQRSEPLWCEG